MLEVKVRYFVYTYINIFMLSAADNKSIRVDQDLTSSREKPNIARL